MLLSDIKSLLISVTSASNIFQGELPDTPDNVLGVFFSGGFDPSFSFDSKQFENPTFQVRIRNKDAVTAMTWAEQVKDALAGKTELIINGSRYISIMQNGDILPLGKDDRGRTDLSLNFSAKVKR